MLLGALVDSRHCTRGLDLGTGTGVLSLMIAQRNPDIHIDATCIELDAASSTESAAIFEQSPFAHQLTATHGKYSTDLASDSLYDLIVANPPFDLGQETRGSDSTLLMKGQACVC